MLSLPVIAAKSSTPPMFATSTVLFFTQVAQGGAQYLYTALAGGVPYALCQHLPSIERLLEALGNRFGGEFQRECIVPGDSPHPSTITLIVGGQSRIPDFDVAHQLRCLLISHEKT